MKAIFSGSLFSCTAAAFGSKGTYLFGSIGMGIKLVPGNSAGTVTAYYVSCASEDKFVRLFGM